MNTLRFSALFLAIAGLTPLSSLSAPSNPVVRNGSANVNQSGTSTTVNQSTNRVAIDWDSFDIAAGESVTFVQPGSDSFALNRVLSNNLTSIAGSISANGNIAIVNPAGVVFNSGSVINVGGLLASGLDIDPDDFMDGAFTLTYEDGTEAYVTNAGSITAAASGSVVLAGKRIVNEGVINAQYGRVSLASGKEAVVSFDSLLSIRVDESFLQSEQEASQVGINNSGSISAEGGQILLTANASREIFAGAVNAGDLGRTKSVVFDSDGSFTLSAGSDVINGGELSVDSDTQNAGQIVVLGDDITHSDGSGSKISASVGAASHAAGSIELHAVKALSVGDVHASSGQGSGGDIKLLGSDIDVLGGAAIFVDASGGTGGGQVLVGGAAGASNASITTADTVTVQEDAKIQADAWASATAGDVVLIAKDSVLVSSAGAGNAYINARGVDPDDGETSNANGGTVEVTAGELDVARLTVTVSSDNAANSAGSVAYQASDIVIGGSGSTDANITEDSANDTWTGDAGNSASYLSIESLLASLNNGADVTVKTFSLGSITLASELDFQGTHGATHSSLSLESHGDIFINADIVNKGLFNSSELNLSLTAGTAAGAIGDVFISPNVSINTNGGGFSVGADGLIDFGLNSAVNSGGGNVTFVNNGDINIGLGAAIATDAGNTFLYSQGDIDIQGSITTAGGDVVIGGVYSNTDYIPANLTLGFQSYSPNSSASSTTDSSAQISVGQADISIYADGDVLLYGDLSTDSGAIVIGGDHDANSATAAISPANVRWHFDEGDGSYGGRDVYFREHSSSLSTVSSGSARTGGELIIGSVLGDIVAGSFNTSGDRSFGTSANELLAGDVSFSAGGDITLAADIEFDRTGNLATPEDEFVITLSAGNDIIVDAMIYDTIPVAADNNQHDRVRLNFTAGNEVQINDHIYTGGESVLINAASVDINSGGLIDTGKSDVNTSVSAISGEGRITITATDVLLEGSLASGADESSAFDSISLMVQNLIYSGAIDSGHGSVLVQGANAQVDSFTINSTATWSGEADTSIKLQGQSGNDIYNLHKDLPFAISDSTGDDEFNFYSNLSTSVDGGADNDTYNLKAAGLYLTIADSTGTADVLNAYQDDASATNTWWALGATNSVYSTADAADTAKVSFSGLETLNGSTGVDSVTVASDFAPVTAPTLNLNSGANSVSIDSALLTGETSELLVLAAGADSDTLSFTGSENLTWSIAAVDDQRVYATSEVGSAPNVIDFSGFENLVGADGNDHFDVDVDAGIVDIRGGTHAVDGADILDLSSYAQDLAWLLASVTGSGLGLTFDGIEALYGSNTNKDTFTYNSTTVPEIINAGSSGAVEPVDELIFSGFSDAITVPESYSGFESITGNGATTLSYASNTNDTINWNVASSGNGSVAGTTNFSGVIALVGSAGNDLFTIADGSGITSVSGGEGSNTLTFDHSNASITLANIVADALDGASSVDSAGDDFSFSGISSITASSADATIQAANQALTWSLNSSGTHQVALSPDPLTDPVVNALSFSGIDLIQGGIEVDRFIVEDGAQLSSLTIDGGATADDVLVLAEADLDIHLKLNGSSDDYEASTVDDAGGAQVIRFTSIENVEATHADAQIHGVDIAQYWQITADGTGSVGFDSNANALSFSGVADISGGSAADAFTFSNSGFLNLVDGGGGGNSLSVAHHRAVFNLPASKVQYDTDSSSANNLEDVVAFSSISSFTGTDTDNTFIAPENQSRTWRINGANSGDVGNWVNAADVLSYVALYSFAGMENLKAPGALNDGLYFYDNGSIGGLIDAGDQSGEDDFISYALVNSATNINLNINAASNGFVNIESVVGNGANTTLTGDNVARTWSINEVNGGSVAGLNFSDVGNLVGGSAADRFEFSDSGSIASIDGGDAADSSAYNTIVGLDSATTYRISGDNSGSVDSYVTSFTKVQNLTGGDAADSFIFSDTSSVLSGLIDGGGPGSLSPAIADDFDIVNYSGLTSVAVTLNGADNGFSNIEKIIGNNSDSVLSGDDVSRTWNIDGANSGEIVGQLLFEGFNALVGGSEADHFVIEDGGSIASINGGTVADSTDNNSLTGKNVDSLFVLSGSNNGSVQTNPGAVAYVTSFESIQSLVGGDQDDVFRADNAVNFSGDIDGGAHDAGDTIDYSRSSVVDLNVDTAMGSATNVEIVKGNNTNSTLRGANTTQTWVISGENDGSVASLNFENFNYLVGGSDKDIFEFTAAGSITGSIVGGSGTNAVDVIKTRALSDAMYSTASTVALSEDGSTWSIAAGGSTYLPEFRQIEQVTADSSASESLNVQAAATWNLGQKGADLSSVEVAGMEFVNFSNHSASSGSDTLNFYNSVAFDGGEGDDIYILMAAGLDMSIVDSGSSTGDELRAYTGSDAWWEINTGNSVRTQFANSNTDNKVNFSGIESLTGSTLVDTVTIHTAQNIAIDTGAGADVFDIRAGSVAIQGGADNDSYQLNFSSAAAINQSITINDSGGSADSISADSAETALWAIDGLTSNTVSSVSNNVVSFNNIEVLDGSALVDTVNVGSSGFAGTINGGDDADVFDIDGAVTTINGGDGADDFDIDGSVTTINGGDGADEFFLAATVTNAYGDGDADSFEIQNNGVAGTIYGGSAASDDSATDVVSRTYSGAEDWNITGDSDGNIDSRVYFNDVESIVGSDTGNDRFIFASTGLMASITGGASGADSLLSREADARFERSGTDLFRVVDVNSGVTYVSTLAAVEILEGRGSNNEVDYSSDTSGVNWVVNGDSS
ncbi:beta strand repeat-containing protein, partial [Agaribacterium haliotis]|uniref:beta strand repeat-containing protein n=1 Tax=Agaribacterium haliotis TaxID=2013869 RepID=UPI001177BB52